MSTSHPTHEPALGAFLKDRRTRLDPATFGIVGTRRRTPGLRREEVAQRANISVTWYTWLERGRGGPPSAAVLDRLAEALVLTDTEREHLFLLALGRPPGGRAARVDGISPRLQRVLDALADSPAYVKTLTWDLVAWNRAAAAVFGYDGPAGVERNILRRIFCDPRIRGHQTDWDGVARMVVSAFRADAVRAAAADAAAVDALVRDLCAASADFATLWRAHDVRPFGEGSKRLVHPDGRTLTLDHSSFIVDGRPELSMIVYTPATAEDAEFVRALMRRAPPPAG